MGLCKRKAIITKFERPAEAYSDFGCGEGRMGYDGGNGPRSRGGGSMERGGHPLEASDKGKLIFFRIRSCAPVLE